MEDCVCKTTAADREVKGWDNGDDEQGEEYKSKIGQDKSEAAGGEENNRQRKKGERKQVRDGLQNGGGCAKQLCDCEG